MGTLVDRNRRTNLLEACSIPDSLCDDFVSGAGTLSSPGAAKRTPCSSAINLGGDLFQFAVCIYGGYFGAGIGILMLATFGFIGLANIHEMNTLKTLLGSLINLVAAIWFMAQHTIDWPRAGVMTVGALAGYYLGSHYSQRIEQRRVRQIITVIGFVLSAVTFYQAFWARPHP